MVDQQSDQQTSWLARQDRLTQLTAVAFSGLTDKISGILTGKEKDKGKNLEEAVAAKEAEGQKPGMEPASRGVQPVSTLSQDVLSGLPKLNGLVSYRMAAVVNTPHSAQAQLPSQAAEPESLNRTAAAV